VKVKISPHAVSQFPSKSSDHWQLGLSRIGTAREINVIASINPSPTSNGREDAEQVVAAATGILLFFGLLMIVPFAAGGSTYFVVLNEPFAFFAAKQSMAGAGFELFDIRSDIDG
jgi:hypothetical protein